MKKTIRTFIANLLLFCLLHTTSKAWGPIFKLEIINDNNQKVPLYIGVDSLATDGYDEEVPFKFGDTVIYENFDLPPAPPTGIYCFIVRDTLLSNDTKSYVDIRSIPENQDEFFHQYRLEIPKWDAANVDNPILKIHWGKLPDGIDSAKISCRGCYGPDSVKYTNMHEDEEFITNNIFHRRFDILVWYNKKHIAIAEELVSEVFYSVENNRLTVNYSDNNYSNEFQTLNIYSLLGTKLLSTSENSIDISGFAIGTYLIELIDKRGKSHTNRLLITR